MAEPNRGRWNQPQLWLEAFSIINFGFLTFDIFLAHSVNQFRNRAEYIPLFFSAIAPVVLIIGLSQWARNRALWKFVGYAVGGTAILVGLAASCFILKASSFMSGPFAVSLIQLRLPRRSRMPGWDCS